MGAKTFYAILDRVDKRTIFLRTNFVSFQALFRFFNFKDFSLLILILKHLWQIMGTISGCWEWVWKLILYLLFCRDNSRKPTPSAYSAYSINKFEWKLTQASLKDCKIYKLNRVENCTIFCTVKTEFAWRDKCTTLLYGGHTGGIKFFFKTKTGGSLPCIDGPT
jgi:hypothetical protein